MQTIEIARAENTPSADTPLTGIWKPKEFVDGDHLLADSDIRDITLSFEKHFHEPLPVSARGMTEVHRLLGFDHTGRVDVAVMPDSPEGLWLRKYLESKSIPYYAFRVRYREGDRGAHPHRSGQYSVAYYGLAATDSTRSITVAPQRRRHSGAAGIEARQ